MDHATQIGVAGAIKRRRYVIFARSAARLRCDRQILTTERRIMPRDCTVACPHGWYHVLC